MKKINYFKFKKNPGSPMTAKELREISRKFNKNFISQASQENHTYLLNTLPGTKDAIAGAFVWIDTAKGHHYWSDLSQRLEEGLFTVELA